MRAIEMAFSSNQNLSNTLPRQIGNCFKWIVTLSTKFFRSVPQFSGLSILCHVLSEVTKLAAMLLPIKIIVILNTNHVPEFLPPIIPYGNVENWVIALTAASCLFFVVHSVCELLVKRFTERGSAILLEKSAKLVASSDQKQFVIGEYGKFVRLCAGVVLSIGLFGVIIAFAPNIAAVMLSYAVTFLILIFALTELQRRLKIKRRINISSVVSLFSAIGFLTTFIFLVYDVLSRDQVNVIVGIVVVFISRIVFASWGQAALCVVQLFQSKDQLAPLIFHGTRVANTVIQDMFPFRRLIDPEQGFSWLRPIISKYHGDDRNFEILAESSESGQRGVVIIEVTVKIDERSTRYLVKLYDRMAIHGALSEIELVSAEVENLPVPQYLGSERVGESLALVFMGLDLHKAKGQELQLSYPKIRQQLIETIPSASLKDKYGRTHLSFSDHFHPDAFDMLGLVAQDRSQNEIVEKFVENLATVKQVLAGLPLTVVCRYLAPEAIYTNGEDKYASLNWNGWQLRPMGAGWPVTNFNFPELREWVNSYAKKVAIATDVLFYQTAIAALCNELLVNLHSWKFAQSLHLIGQINSFVDDLTDNHQSEDFSLTAKYRS